MTATAALTHETFAPCLGQPFQIETDAEPALDCELVEVTPRSEQRDGRRPFSLLFRGPAAPILPQRIYRLRHPTLGELDLFLVPIGPSGDGIGYEAVFN